MALFSRVPEGYGETAQATRLSIPKYNQDFTGENARYGRPGRPSIGMMMRVPQDAP